MLEYGCMHLPLIMPHPDGDDDSSSDSYSGSDEDYDGDKITPKETQVSSVVRILRNIREGSAGTGKPPKTGTSASSGSASIPYEKETLVQTIHALYDELRTLR